MTYLFLEIFYWVWLKKEEERNLGEKFLDKKTDTSIKEYIMGSGITVTNSEITDIMKVIKYLENRAVLLKGTVTEITIQERGFLNFVRPLMAAGYH